MENKAKTIFTASIARQLLKKGNKIIDIKPYRDAKGRTIFVFDATEQFFKDFEEIVNNKKKEKDA